MSTLLATLTIGDVCEDEEVRDPSRRPDEPFQYIDISGVDNIAKAIVEPRSLLGRDAPSRARKVVRVGDVIVSTTRPNLNAVARVPASLDDQICSTGFCVLRPKRDRIDPGYLFAFVQSPSFVGALSELVSGALYPAVRDKDVFAQPIPLPPLPEQRRIAGKLEAGMAAAARARAAAQARLAAAHGIVSSVFDELWRRGAASAGRHPSLQELATAEDAFADGPFGSNLKTEHYSQSGVRVIRLQNIGNYRFLDRDKAFVSREHGKRLQRHSAVSGDIVVAALGDGSRPAGRACTVPPHLGDAIVKADCFRVRLPPDRVRGEFVAAVLCAPASLERFAAVTRGATRPRVNLSMLRSVTIPVPPLSVQDQLLSWLHVARAATESLVAAAAAELAAVEALPGALLREAFGRAGTAAAPVEDVTIEPPSLPNGIFFKRGAIASYIVDRLHAKPTFGRVHFEKNLYLTEAYVGVDLAGRYKREAAGPLDADFLYKLESLAFKQHWFSKHKRGAEGYYYRPGSDIAGRVAAAETILGDRRERMDRLLALTGAMSTEQVEIVATLFAAWNDRLIEGKPVTDELVIEDVRERWNVSKQRFEPERLQAALDWMREHEMVPRGRGPLTVRA